LRQQRRRRRRNRRREPLVSLKKKHHCKLKLKQRKKAAEEKTQTKSSRGSSVFLSLATMFKLPPWAAKPTCPSSLIDAAGNSVPTHLKVSKWGEYEKEEKGWNDCEEITSRFNATRFRPGPPTFFSFPFL
jgi:hypothetical protein